jgi:predicted GTPase
MGNCGTGKTSLFNKLCDKNYPTGFTTNGESQTADIDFEDVAYTEPNKFRMYDSPGTDSVSDALHLALILRTSLTCLSINLVIVSVKFETPILPIFSQLKKFL